MCCDGVVFIDDGNDAHPKQLFKGVLRVDAIDIVGNCLTRHQNLRRHLIIFCKNFLISHHQACLTDRRTCLLDCDRMLLQLLRRQMHRLFALGDSAGRNEHNVLSLIFQIAQLPHQNLQADIIHIAGFGMLQGRRTDFNDNSLFLFQQVSSGIHVCISSFGHLPVSENGA